MRHSTALSLLPLAPIAARTQQRTTASDTLHPPGGIPQSGTITITGNSTLTATYGMVAPRGTTVNASVATGAFSVALEPATSSPSVMAQTGRWRQSDTSGPTSAAS